MVQDMIDNAYARDTLRIGVVEYVRTAKDSHEHLIPAEWRHIVSVYTVSSRVATTQRAARKLCIDELFRNEPYVLFVRAAKMHMYWDYQLINSFSDSSFVVSTHVNRDGRVTFPCVVDGEPRQRSPANLDEATTKLTPSLIAQTELIFFSSEATRLVLSTSDDVALSATLATNGFLLVVPMFSVASRSSKPNGVNRGKLGPRSQLGIKYANENGFGTNSTAKARLGLTPNADSAEIIAKFGSVVGARIAIQEEEASQTKCGRQNTSTPTK